MPHLKVLSLAVKVCRLNLLVIPLRHVCTLVLDKEHMSLRLIISHITAIISQSHQVHLKPTKVFQTFGMSQLWVRCQTMALSSLHRLRQRNIQFMPHNFILRSPALYGQKDTRSITPGKASWTTATSVNTLFPLQDKTTIPLAHTPITKSTTSATMILNKLLQWDWYMCFHEE